jgi:predicted N-acetyltransferase YhbS
VTQLPLLIQPEDPRDDDAIERLHDRAFGPGRYARTAFRLREGASQCAELSFTALVGTLLVGSVRLGPIWAGSVPGLILGPLAVDPAFEGRGIGGALVEASLAAARRSGCADLVLLVGDQSYYSRFGFRRIPRGQLAMPGPVDPDRFLALELAPSAMERARGSVRPRVTP